MNVLLGGTCRIHFQICQTNKNVGLKLYFFHSTDAIFDKNDPRSLRRQTSKLRLELWESLVLLLPDANGGSAVNSILYLKQRLKTKYKVLSISQHVIIICKRWKVLQMCHADPLETQKSVATWQRKQVFYTRAKPNLNPVQVSIMRCRYPAWWDPKNTSEEGCRHHPLCPIGKKKTCWVIDFE